MIKKKNIYNSFLLIYTLNLLFKICLLLSIWSFLLCLARNPWVPPQSQSSRLLVVGRTRNERLSWLWIRLQKARPMWIPSSLWYRFYLSPIFLWTAKCIYVIYPFHSKFTKMSVLLISLLLDPNFLSPFTLINYFYFFFKNMTM